MKKLLPLLLALALMAGCSQPAPEPTATPEPTAAPTAAPTATPDPTPTPEPTATPAPTNISHTTGLLYTGEYKPLAVMIENSSAARPQRGLQQADIVYETPVEGGVTRFMAIFCDTIPETVMPVRSARSYHLRIQQEWDCVYIHYGGTESRYAGTSHTSPISCYDDKADHIRVNIDGILGKYDKYFRRMTSRSAPHNVEGFLQVVQNDVGYSPQPLPWVFGDGGYTGDTVAEVSIPFYGNSRFVSYRYDGAADKFVRFMGGKEFIAEETGSAVTVQNVIVQYAVITEYMKTGVRLIELTGRGRAEFFIGGVHVSGTWERADFDAPTLFKDLEGNPLVLKPGNTWIHLAPEDRAIGVEYAG